ncbi:hypothetical protein BDV96DRAFT_598225 [Lophiotrema nucula]|uniref:Uncharacterized protein n=1 Tax=Lophiotrema nucula TaxID=690887 RepID=A0A6A5ZFX2_9PLEO|nr:hypothetical protein BDV96DRAFT_598225 [Lophiotrema nucula]
MVVGRPEHRGKGAHPYQSARECRNARQPSQAPSLPKVARPPRRGRQPSPDYPSEHPYLTGITDSYAPNYDEVISSKRPLCKHRLPLDEDIKEESDSEEGEISSVSSIESCPFHDETSSRRTEHIYNSDPYFLDRKGKMSSRLNNPRVIGNWKQRQYHIGKQVERRFNTNFDWVVDMMAMMNEQYDCCTVYSYGLIMPGDIIYYLSAFVDEYGQAKTKGRFAVVIDVYDQCAKVVDMYTFNGLGLASAKPQHVWYEYVGLWSPAFENYFHPSREDPLELGWACCEMFDTTSIFLRPGRVTLSDNIMLAGYITKESLSRLRGMIKKVDN